MYWNQWSVKNSTVLILSLAHVFQVTIIPLALFSFCQLPPLLFAYVLFGTFSKLLLKSKLKLTRIDIEKSIPDKRSTQPVTMQYLVALNF